MNIHDPVKSNVCQRTNLPLFKILFPQQGTYECGACRSGFKKDARGRCLHVAVCEGAGGSSHKNPCSIYAVCKSTANGAMCEVIHILKY